MNKIAISIIATISIILIIAGSLIYSVSSSETKTAYLMDITGDVMVDQGHGYKTAYPDMELSVNDKIKTTSGTAIVAIYESILITVKDNTEIEVFDLAKDNIIVKQKEGTLWSKFTGLLGVSEYSIETPDTVATVRGTSFKTEVDNGKSEILVAEGTVETNSNGKTIMVKSNEKVSTKDGQLELKKLTEDDKKEILEQLNKNIKNLRSLRNKEIEKHPKIYSTLKSQFNLTDNDVKQAFTDMENGKLDEDELIAKSPINIDSLYKIKDINNQIRKEKTRLNEVE